MKYEELSKIEQLVLRLTYCQGIGLVGKWRVVKFYEKFQTENFSLEEILQIAQITQYKGVFRKSYRAIEEEKLAQVLASQNFISWKSEQYPQLLLNLPFPPLFLFYAGNLDLLETPLLAFVGARQASLYARQVIDKLIPPLVAKQWVIVSGLAKGVDRMSHERTLAAGGNTIGVVGCGLDRCYPQEVYYLFEKMKTHQLVLSEYPSGIGVKKHHFPMRNRIIAGLSQATCVIEAKERSGSLITAQQALEYGKDVFAIPGEILSGRSNGCHRLIQDGAKCVVDPADILEELPLF